MDRSLFTESGHKILLGSQVGRGGEGSIYEISRKPDLVAKIYKPDRTSPEMLAKLQAMLSNPPIDSTRANGHISIAWPTDILFEKYNFVGYLMPRIRGSSPIFDLYHPLRRSKHFRGFNLHHLLNTAKNVTVALDALHRQKHIFGDFNESNILVAQNTMVTFIDTDSYQVFGNNGKVYRCMVGKPEFTPPELQQRKLETIDRLPAHDYFGLAVTIFYLLMEGYHPFQGILTNPKLSISQVDLYCIQQNIFPYFDTRLASPSPNSPSFNTLPPKLQRLFKRCFIDGHRDPLARPNPREWNHALIHYESNLAQCNVDKDHLYSNHLDYCPCCERKHKQSTQSGNINYKKSSRNVNSLSQSVTANSLQKPLIRLLSLNQWWIGVRFPLVIGAVVGFLVAYLISLLFSYPAQAGTASGLLVASIVAIITFALAQNVNENGCVIVLGILCSVLSCGFLYNYVPSILYAYSYANLQLYMVSISICALIGITLGNFKLLPKLNYSLSALFLTICWILLPTYLIWTSGFISSPFVKTKSVNAISTGTSLPTSTPANNTPTIAQPKQRNIPEQIPQTATEVSSRPKNNLEKLLIQPQIIEVTMYGKLLNNSERIGPSDKFPNGLEEIYTSFAYRNMTKNTVFFRRWIGPNGNVEAQHTEEWPYAKYGASGKRDLDAFYNRSGWPDGTYILELWINDKLQKTYSFDIGSTDVYEPLFTRTPTPWTTPTIIIVATPQTEIFKEDILWKIGNSKVPNDYPAQAVLFTNALIFSLGEFPHYDDIGDRISGVTHIIWSDWVSRASQHNFDPMKADPNSYGFSPFRQLVIRMIQSRQTSLNNNQVDALYNFLMRSEEVDAWTKNVNGVIASINRENFQ